MQSEGRRFPLPSWRFFPFKRSSLRAHMTVSYVAVSIGSALTFMLLAELVRAILVALIGGADGGFPAVMQQQAQTYALSAEVQAEGVALDPTTNFIPGQAHTIFSDNQQFGVPAPYISTTAPDSLSISIVMLIAPDGHLVASSYPARYPAGMPASALLPEQRQAIDHALAGQASAGTEQFSSVALGYAAEPVWSKEHQPIGAIFLQAPFPARESIFSRLVNDLVSEIPLLLLVTPVGLFFGWLATRGLVRRVQQLALATTQFAGGDYSQRVASVHQDEIGQLERQFNQMAGQLVEHISQRQQLAEQNARLEERSRISRELHDAISQDLFSLRMLADGLQEATQTDSSSAKLRPHIVLLEQTSANITREMRALLLELRPTQLEKLGLAGALKELAHAYSARLGITVTADLQPVTLDVKAEHALLRIAQESFANAARHSGASIISLSLGEQGGLVQLTIVDNGEGFSREQERAGHGLGLHLMQERVEELRGTFDLQTAPGHGTTITVHLPIGGACDQGCAG